MKRTLSKLLAHLQEKARRKAARRSLREMHPIDPTLCTTALPLIHAALCFECETVFEMTHRKTCPCCTGSSWGHVSTLLMKGESAFTLPARKPAFEPREVPEVDTAPVQRSRPRRVA